MLVQGILPSAHSPEQVVRKSKKFTEDWTGAAAMQKNKS
jgi:hypothetical protein